MNWWDKFIIWWNNVFYQNNHIDVPSDSELTEPTEPTDPDSDPQEETGMKRFACCTAINNYKGSSNDLRGCVNDAKDWADLIKSKGWKEQDITMLLDKRATKRNVTNAWKEIFQKAKAGDKVFLSFSGHGSHQKDYNGDEADGRDENIVMYDGYLSDDEIRAIFDTKAEGVELFFVSDSCHSGTVTRSFLETMSDESFYSAPRFLPPEDDLEEASIQALPLPKRSLGSPKEEDMNHILLSGCLPTEYSYDARIGGVFRGAMSYHATKIIRENPDITYDQFYKKLKKQLPSNRYPQTPQLEGKGKNLKILG
jgi:hypothetical protein